jgi:hypothetical protein
MSMLARGLHTRERAAKSMPKGDLEQNSCMAGQFNPPEPQGALVEKDAFTELAAELVDVSGTPAAVMQGRAWLRCRDWPQIS